MKSLSSSFLGLYEGILSDFLVIHPTLRKDVDRDLKRLHALTSAHGEKVFTLLLPAVGKMLDLSFQTGILDFDGLPLTRSFHRDSKIPRLFRGIWMMVAEDNGCLKLDIDSTTILFLRTLLYAGKRYAAECTPASVMKTVKEYYDVDSTLPPPSKLWDGDGSDDWVRRDRSLHDLAAPTTGLFATSDGREDVELLDSIQLVCDRVAGYLGEYLPSVSRFRHGPGAVSDLAVRKDFKYSFPQWGPRLQWVFPAVEFAVFNSSMAPDDNSFDAAGIPLIEGASRLYAVPKTQKGPRLIAAEPTCNQWCQQSVRSFLSDAIAASPIGKSIDFRRQDLSGKMASAASLTGSHATVDLSEASDRLSCFVVERVFRSNDSLLSAMVACRTRYLLNDIDKKSPKLYKLRKFASMGSALTFPIQSLVFLCICLGAGIYSQHLNIKDLRHLFRQVRVYGDDLIVPVSWMPSVERGLMLCHLKVNRTKTFTRGNFRESCGSDCFRGDDVTPGQVRQFYNQSAPGTLQGVVDTSNNLFLKGMWNASQRILDPVRDEIRKLIPTVKIGSGTFGLISGSGFQSKSRKRWNIDYQRHEYLSVFFGSRRSGTFRHEGSANLLQYFTEDPSTQDLSSWESGVIADPLPVIRKGWVGVPA
jgi:hypothetical protein